MKDEKDLAILKDFISLLFLLFSSTVTRAFPCSIKGKAGHPMEGDWNRIDPGQTRSNHHEPIEP